MIILTPAMRTSIAVHMRIYCRILPIENFLLIAQLHMCGMITIIVATILTLWRRGKQMHGLRIVSIFLTTHSEQELPEIMLRSINRLLLAGYILLSPTS